MEALQAFRLAHRQNIQSNLASSFVETEASMTPLTTEKTGEGAIPIVHHERVQLCDGNYITHWLYWPLFGTSILHSMTKERGLHDVRSGKCNEGCS